MKRKLRKDTTENSFDSYPTRKTSWSNKQGTIYIQIRYLALYPFMKICDCYVVWTRAIRSWWGFLSTKLQTKHSLCFVTQLIESLHQDLMSSGSNSKAKQSQILTIHIPSLYSSLHPFNSTMTTLSSLLSYFLLLHEMNSFKYGLII